jgi:hypothetical protein
MAARLICKPLTESSSKCRLYPVYSEIGASENIESKVDLVSSLEAIERDTIQYLEKMNNLNTSLSQYMSSSWIQVHLP